jgi:hypothetical protein
MISRLLSGFGLAASISPHIAEAARKGQRRANDQERKNDDTGGNRDEQGQSNQKQRASDPGDEKASAEGRDSSNDSGRSGKRVRDENRNESDEGSNQSGSDSGKSRNDSRRRDDEADSSSRQTSSEDDSNAGSGRRVREFEQRADDPLPDPDAPAAVPPTNPNVVDIPTTSVADLVVEANDDVIATVSASGGFAFARSGDVIAFTGPDGASIIQTGDVTTPVEPPDDGGNNDPDFTS